MTVAARHKVSDEIEVRIRVRVWVGIGMNKG